MSEATAGLEVAKGMSDARWLPAAFYVNLRRRGGKGGEGKLKRSFAS